MKGTLAVSVFGLLSLGFTTLGFGQSLGNAGTIQGMVLDSSGGALPNASVTIRNAVSGHTQSTISASDGSFRIANIPPNPYHLEVTVKGFNVFKQDVDIRSAVPVQVKATLDVAGSKETINVEAAGADMLEVEASAHVDTDRTLLMKLPNLDPGAGLSQAIVYSTGGVAADGNGFFHPLGDHAQVSFVVDGQPISDQQSKVFSTQLPANAIQSMELITGAPNAEYGDKSSLIVNATTKSGLGAHPFGSLEAAWGSFATYSENGTFGFGDAKFGNFIAVDGIRTGHFLDTPEFLPIHDIGNNETIFDRVDYKPNDRDTFHLNLFVARNWFQVPNSYDQLSQDQKQRVMTWSFSPAYQ